MTEFPGYLPWHVGGDPWLTYDEIDALMDALRRRADERRKAAGKARRGHGKRARRGRRR
jgi:hypothetical protein